MANKVVPFDKERLRKNLVKYNKQRQRKVEEEGTEFKPTLLDSTYTKIQMLFGYPIWIPPSSSSEALRNILSHSLVVDKEEKEDEEIFKEHEARVKNTMQSFKKEALVDSFTFLSAKDTHLRALGLKFGEIFTFESFCKYTKFYLSLQSLSEGELKQLNTIIDWKAIAFEVVYPQGAETKEAETKEAEIKGEEIKGAENEGAETKGEETEKANSLLVVESENKAKPVTMQQVKDMMGELKGEMLLMNNSTKDQLSQILKTLKTYRRMF